RSPPPKAGSCSSTSTNPAASRDAPRAPAYRSDTPRLARCCRLLLEVPMLRFRSWLRTSRPNLSVRRAADIWGSQVMPDYEVFEAGNVVLQSGLTYRGARLAYKTFGTLNADKSNVIVHPTSYGAQYTDLEWAVQPGKALDPTKYFVVIINKFGNG